MPEAINVLWGVAAFSLSDAANLADVATAASQQNYVDVNQRYHENKRLIFMHPAFQRRYFDVLAVRVDEVTVEPTAANGVRPIAVDKMQH
jgi:hypothetical protein